MDFTCYDEVVYNPNSPDLAPPTQRLRDWGRIVRIENGYLHICFYCDYPEEPPRRILPPSITHSPRSHKYFKNIYTRVVKSVKQEAFTVKYKQIYRRVLSDIRNYGYEKAHQDLLRSCSDGSQSFFSALDATV
jgi:hypothetical protein